MEEDGRRRRVLYSLCLRSKSTVQRKGSQDRPEESDCRWHDVLSTQQHHPWSSWHHGLSRHQSCDRLYWIRHIGCHPDRVSDTFGVCLVCVTSPPARYRYVSKLLSNVKLSVVVIFVLKTRVPCLDVTLSPWNVLTIFVTKDTHLKYNESSCPDSCDSLYTPLLNSVHLLLEPCHSGFSCHRTALPTSKRMLCSIPMHHDDDAESTEKKTRLEKRNKFTRQWWVWVLLREQLICLRMKKTFARGIRKRNECIKGTRAKRDFSMKREMNEKCILLQRLDYDELGISCVFLVLQAL